MKKILFFFVAFFFIYNVTYAQNVTWKAGFDGFADNREYSKKIHYPQTMFGARAKFGGNINFEENHNLFLGVNYLYEFGATNKSIENLDFTLYYKFQKEHFRFLTGTFPRAGLLNYPIALLTDTLLYYQPNIEGLYFEWYNRYFNQNIWIDWTGRQDDYMRETFMAGSSGLLKIGKFYVENYLLLYHHALQRIPDQSQHINDYLGFDIGGGIDLTSTFNVDSLSISVYNIRSFFRDRGDGILHKPNGFIFNLNFEYKKVGTNLLWYKGERQHFFWGDTFYRTPNYARWDFNIFLFKSSALIKSFVRWSLHFTEGEIDNSQQFYISINLDELAFRKTNKFLNYEKRNY